MDLDNLTNETTISYIVNTLKLANHLCQRGMFFCNDDYNDITIIFYDYSTLFVLLPLLLLLFLDDFYNVINNNTTKSILRSWDMYFANCQMNSPLETIRVQAANNCRQVEYLLNRSFTPSSLIANVQGTNMIYDSSLSTNNTFFHFLLWYVDDSMINVDVIRALSVQQALCHNQLIISAIWIYQHLNRTRVHEVLIDYLEKFIHCMC